MKKRVLATILALCTVLAMLPGTALAAASGIAGVTRLSPNQTFTVNGNAVKASDSNLTNCSKYASAIQEKIWGHTAEDMTIFTSPYNLVKDKSAEARTITAQHVKEYIQAAPPGSRIRITNTSSTTADNHDNNGNGHTLVLIDKDNRNGTFVAFDAHNWLADGKGVQGCATQYTYQGFVNCYTAHKYFFYIADYSAVHTSGGCGENATWNFDQSTGTLTISGSGRMADFIYSLSPWQHWNSDIRSVEISSSITYIGRYAFQKCTRLTNVSIPSSVTSIGPSAFAECTGLTNVSIPSSVTSIGEGAFVGCTNLKNVSIPHSVTRIENSTFAGCTGLTNVNIPSSVTSISYWAFSHCSSLTNVSIPSSVTHIYGSAFVGCTSLTSVTIPPSVTHIYGGLAGAFQNCTSLASVTIPSSVTVIQSDTFSRCSKLANIYYYGTEAQWKKFNVELPSITKVHYNCRPTPDTYTLTFNANGGLCNTSTKKVTANATYGTLPAAHRTGYTLSGWYTAKSGGKKVTASTKATSNATLYARWTKAKRTYQVNFNANGGDVLQESKAVVRGSTYRELPTPTRPGYHFTGWYTKSTGGVKITEKTKVNLTANQTLYARWSKTAVRATTKNGSWKVDVPAYYNVMLYSSNTSAAPAGYIPEKASVQTLTCTKMASLSNGTTRYCTKLSSGKYYWFTYTCEMDVN